jgi:glutamate 5-kinase
MNIPREFDSIGRLIIKVGSSTVMRSDMGELTRTLANLKRKGLEIVLVSSGAVAAGMEMCGTSERPSTVPKLQALAAMGQARLMGRYQDHFKPHDVDCAQVLLTHEALATRSNFLNIRDTLRELLSMGVIPIVNENDTVATEELRFGDNDRLAAALGSVIDADLVILLSDVDALYEKDPHAHPEAKRIPSIEMDDAFLDTLSSSTSSQVGTGGMASKVAAARLCCAGGIGLVIANGADPKVVESILNGADVGTYFLPKQERVGRRRQWIAALSKIHGSIVVDQGAERALVRGGSSLLAVGVLKVEGDPPRGSAVRVVSEEGVEIARGLIRYDGQQLRAILGLSTKEVCEKLNVGAVDPVIHRNDLSLTALN